MYKLKWNYSTPTYLSEPKYYWNILSKTQLASKRQVRCSINTMWLYMYYSTGQLTPTQSAQAWMKSKYYVTCVYQWYLWFGTPFFLSAEILYSQNKRAEFSYMYLQYWDYQNRVYLKTFPRLSLFCFALIDYALH